MWGSCDQHRAVFGLSQFTNQDGGLANRTKLTKSAKTMNPKLTRQGGFLNSTFYKDMATKMVKRLIHCETPDLL